MGINASKLGGIGSVISQFGGAIGGPDSMAANIAPIATNVAQSSAQAEYEKQRAAEEKKAKRGGIFKKVLGTAGTIAGSMIPGVGPIVGPMIGSAIGNTAGQMAAGERVDLAESLMSGAQTGMGSFIGGQMGNLFGGGGAAAEGAGVKMPGAHEVGGALESVNAPKVAARKQKASDALSSYALGSMFLQ